MRSSCQLAGALFEDVQLKFVSGVVAGGQTGVDQAALAVAHDLGLATGLPKGCD